MVAVVWGELSCYATVFGVETAAAWIGAPRLPLIDALVRRRERVQLRFPWGFSHFFRLERYERRYRLT